jgi:hypothetical protein
MKKFALIPLLAACACFANADEEKEKQETQPSTIIPAAAILPETEKSEATDEAKTDAVVDEKTVSDNISDDEETAKSTKKVAAVVNTDDNIEKK